MKPRSNPTAAQMLRRLQRSPESQRDPRYKNDAYWALRKEGYPDSYAKRAFRDQPPISCETTMGAGSNEYGCDSDDLLIPAGSTFTKIEVVVRPELTQKAILSLYPRDTEYTVWDHQVASFGVRVRPTGYMSYLVYFRVRHKAKVHKFTIGKTSEFSLEQAREVAKNYKRAARLGKNPLTDRASLG